MTPLKQKLDELIEKKLVRVKAYPDKDLYVYKYNNKVFYDNLWHKSPYLLKARGLILDGFGNIVQHPFDKVFNFNENGTGKNIPMSKEVVVVEKLNGFLACVSLHKGELLLSTTGSIDSDFVGLIKDLIDKPFEERLISYLKENNNTLMFEAIHPKDPHIIAYDERDQGLWLIGARGKAESDKNQSETALDEMAKVIGVRRGVHFTEQFDKVLARVKTDKIEGYMIQDPDTGETLLKLKTNYYLNTKFIGRMGINNINMMYDKTSLFKEKVEEEFYETVDAIIAKVDKLTLLSMSNENKVELVREIIEDLNRARPKMKSA